MELVRGSFGKNGLKTKCAVTLNLTMVRKSPNSVLVFSNSQTTIGISTLFQRMYGFFPLH